MLLRKVINAAGVKVDGLRVKAAHRLRAGERISDRAARAGPRGPAARGHSARHPVRRRRNLAVINKPPGMVVHPAKGHWAGTLTAALQFHFDQLSTAGGPTRPGIVHRLDRDTSGVMVVAKTDQAHMRLADQFEHRTVEKEYFAICAGVPGRDRDLIDLPVGAHPHQREKMAIRRDHATSRAAQTFYEVVERFDGFAAIRVLPKTGRTHQIRLHLASIGCPVLCDRLYGGRAHDHPRRTEPRSGGRRRAARSPGAARAAAEDPPSRSPASRWSSSRRCRPISRRCSTALRQRCERSR